MGFDPSEARDKDGKWTAGGGGFSVGAKGGISLKVRKLHEKQVVKATNARIRAGGTLEPKRLKNIKSGDSVEIRGLSQGTVKAKFIGFEGKTKSYVTVHAPSISDKHFSVSSASIWPMGGH